MAISIPPSTVRLSLLFVLISLHMTWYNLLNKHVPEPYLDEVFHIPQAQAYWAGRWSHWDDKITTPPGLYLWSYVFTVVRRLTQADPEEMVSVEELRFSNIVLVYLLMVTLYIWVAVARKPVNGEAVLQKEIAMLAFPLLAFFSGLYYTDLFSALTVIATFVMWETGRRCAGVAKFVSQLLHVVLGLLSLASRQTNIFWVAVFLGGLQIIETLQTATSDGIRDPDMGEASIEDTFHLILQLIPAALLHLPSLVLALWPQLILLASFVGFIVWNGGVVLGDKSNHVATIHLPQLLYIWPCFVFFSWPVLLQQIAGLRSLNRQLPRAWLATLTILAMMGAVHYNTIVHPFTLADNRHYVFYVFQILMRRSWVKYAVVPVYFVCANLVLGALGGGRRDLGGDDGSVRLSFALVWFASTALSLVTAPLVEPRYFIVPWLIWRMNVPEIKEGTPKGEQGVKSRNVGSKQPVNSAGLLEKALRVLADYSLWIELAWYLSVNYATGWMFLNRGFEWQQEPGKIQRFMW